MRSIVTKTGDSGLTSLLNNHRVYKNDSRISAIGDIDELNALLGIVIAHLDSSGNHTILTQIQNNLFIIGSELATFSIPENNTLKNNHLPILGSEHLASLENKLFEIEKNLLPQTSFILPCGTKVAAFFHLARAVCRRAERSVVTCQNEFASFWTTTELNPNILKYLNRLSDFLFLLARNENNQPLVGDVPVNYNLL